MKQVLRKALLGAFGVSISLPVLAWDEDREAAMALTPNLDNGRKVYEACAVCHTPWAGACSAAVIRRLQASIRT